MLKDVSEDSEHFHERRDIFQYVDDAVAFPDDLMVQASRKVLGEWSTFETETKTVLLLGGEHTQQMRMTVFEWAMGLDHPGKRFDLWRRMHSDRLEDSFSVVPRLLLKVFQKAKFTLACLYSTLISRKLLLSTREDEEVAEGIFAGHFVRTAEILDSCYSICLEELRVRVNLPDENGGWKRYEAASEDQKMIRPHLLTVVEDQDLTPFQRVHAFLLNLLRLRGYRKSGELLYQPIFVDELRTGAWEPAYAPPHPSNFATFYTENVTRQTNYKVYLDATSSFSIRREMIRQLEEEEEPECPTLVFSRRFISFRNAIVDVCGAVFPLRHPELWQGISDRKNAEYADFAQACAARLRARGVDVDHFSLLQRVMEDTGEDMRIRPPSGDDATIAYIPEDLPEELWDLRFDGSNFVGSEAAEAAEVDPADPWDSPIFAYLDDLATPEFDEVQKTQHWDRATRFWDLSSMGRGFFPGKTMDNAHFFPMHQGRAGTGKSLKLQILQSYFPKERVGVLSSKGGEKTFWSTGMQHVFILFWLEVQNTGTPPIDRGTFQQMIGYELVNLPQKGEKSIMMGWRAPTYVSGNEYFNYQDSSGSLRRRTMTFLYDHKPSARDPLLEEKIREKRGPLLLKMLHSYALQLMLFPGMDWQARIPVAAGSTRERVPIIGRQMDGFHTRAVEQLDPLQSFMNQDNMFQFAPDLKMAEADFISDYNAYRRERLGLERARWSQAHYQIAFENLDVTRGTSDMQDPATGAIRPTSCLLGIAPREADGEPVL